MTVIIVIRKTNDELVMLKFFHRNVFFSIILYVANHDFFLVAENKKDRLLYIKSSTPRGKGDNGRLISPIISPVTKLHKS